MKIIAIINDTGYGSSKYLAEVTADELNVIGYGGERRCDRYDVGCLVSVSDQWNRIKDIDAAQSRLDSATASLRAIAELLQTIDVVVPPVHEKGGAE